MFHFHRRPMLHEFSCYACKRNDSRWICASKELFLNKIRKSKACAHFTHFYRTIETVKSAKPKEILLFLSSEIGAKTVKLKRRRRNFLYLK